MNTNLLTTTENYVQSNNEYNQVGKPPPAQAARTFRHAVGKLHNVGAAAPKFGAVGVRQ